MNGGALGSSEEHRRKVTLEYKFALCALGLHPVFDALHEDPRATFINDYERLSGEALAAAMEQHKKDTREATLDAIEARDGVRPPENNEQFVNALTSTYKPEVLVKKISLFVVREMIDRNDPSDRIDADCPFKFKAGADEFWRGEDGRHALLKSWLESMQADDGVADELKAEISKALTPIQPKCHTNSAINDRRRKVKSCI